MCSRAMQTASGTRGSGWRRAKTTGPAARWHWTVTPRSSACIATARRARPTSSCAVYVFTRDGALWKQTLLLGGDEGKEKGFGHAVAIHGDVILAAAAWGSSGSVHVWERTESEWDWVQTLASPRGAEDHFGDSISLFAYTALIAAPGSGDLGEWFGSVYTFKRVPEPMR